MKTLHTLLDVELWVVGALVAGSFLTDQLLLPAAAAAGVFWLLRLVAERRLTRRTPLDWGVGLLLLMVPVTLWATALPEKTLPQVYRLLSGIGLCYALVHWARTPSRLRWAALGAVSTGLGLAVFAAGSVEWTTFKLPFIPVDIYERFTILVADTVHPNVMAGSLVLLLPLALALPLFGWRDLRPWERLLTVGTALVMGLVLGLTQSRGAMMALGTVGILLVTLRWRWGWTVILAGVAAVWYLATSFGPTNLLNTLVGSRALGGFDGRVEIWSRGIYMIQDFSFTGVGMGLYGDVADLIYPFFLIEPGNVPHAHNLFVQVGVDLGVPGLVAWLAIWLGVTGAAWGVYRMGLNPGARSAEPLGAAVSVRQSSPETGAATPATPRADSLGVIGGTGSEPHPPIGAEPLPTPAGGAPLPAGLARALGAGLLASNLALAVHGLTDAVTWGMVRPAPIVWAVWGLATAARLLKSPVAKREKRPPIGE